VIVRPEPWVTVAVGKATIFSYALKLFLMAWGSPMGDDLLEIAGKRITG
jgi:hypothetical protein